MDKDILKNVKNDKFAQLLGIEIVEASPGYALVEMKIEDKHKNGINIVQGGAIFTLADYAFAIASNADGSTTVGINASISYFKAPTGAYIRAEAREESKFIDDLVQDTIADEDELQQAVSNNAD